MNSRDADILQEVLDASAAEAAAGGDGTFRDANGVLIATEDISEETVDLAGGGRRKRKKIAEDAYV